MNQPLLGGPGPSEFGAGWESAVRAELTTPPFQVQRPPSRSMPTSSARSVRSSSQSIGSSAKARLSGCPQNSPILSARSKSGQHQDVEQLGAGSRTQGFQAFLQPALELVGAHGRRLRDRRDEARGAGHTLGHSRAVLPGAGSSGLFPL